MEKTNRKGGARKGAGAKPYAEQNLARSVANLGLKIVLQALQKEGEFEYIENDVWLELARDFALKSMPTKIEGDMNHTFTEMGKITRDGKPLECRIG